MQYKLIYIIRFPSLYRHGAFPSALFFPVFNSLACKPQTQRLEDHVLILRKALDSYLKHFKFYIRFDLPI